MQNTRSRLEKRLAQLSTPHPLAARHTAGHPKVDMAYLDEETQDRLNNSQPE